MHRLATGLGGWVVLASLALTGCGAGATSAVEGSEASSGRDARTSPDLESVLDGLASLSSMRGRVFGECMAGKGFPQPLERLEWSKAEVEPRYDQGPLTIAPIDLGPTTTEEARQYGLVGSSLPLLGRGPAEIVSRSEDFDSSVEECDALVVRKVPELGSLQGDGAAFQDEVRRELVKRSERQLTSLIVDRYRCVQGAGYPQLDPDKAVTSDDWEGVLSQVGIRPGEFRERSAERPQVADGAVAVFPPAESRQYVPSEQEIAFSVTLAECGESIRFLNRFHAIMERSRADVTDDYTTEAKEFHTRLTEVTRQIDGVEFQ